jgi:hypothetical protein
LFPAPTGFPTTTTRLLLWAAESGEATPVRVSVSVSTIGVRAAAAAAAVERGGAAVTTGCTTRDCSGSGGGGSSTAVAVAVAAAVVVVVGCAGGCVDGEWCVDSPSRAAADVDAAGCVGYVGCVGWVDEGSCADGPIGTTTLGIVVEVAGCGGVSLCMCNKAGLPTAPPALVWTTEGRLGLGVSMTGAERGAAVVVEVVGEVPRGDTGVKRAAGRRGGARTGSGHATDEGVVVGDLAASSLRIHSHGPLVSPPPQVWKPADR